MCLAVPGKIVEIYEVGGLKMGRVDFGGVFHQACLEYIPDIQVGDYTIIHAGFAISRLNKEDAQSSLAMLQEIGNSAEELGLNQEQA